MKKLLIPIIGLAAFCVLAQTTVTVKQDLSKEQVAALKYLQSLQSSTNSALTNVTVKDFATNFTRIEITDVVEQAQRARCNAIAGQLRSAPDDALTAIEAVLKWSADTDLTKAKVGAITNIIAKLPGATVNKLGNASSALD